jgi:spore coat polysaccharide biosynthesis protein SpsF
MNEKGISAILACRVQGARLYGKPLQTLEPGGITIIESLIENLRKIQSLDKIILAISEGDENYGFVRIAQKHNLPFYFGDEHDVLKRIIHCAEEEKITNILRITTEGPFVIWEYADKLIAEFIAGSYDWATYTDSPEGTGYELIKTSALQISHSKGTDRNRSELVTSYICENQEEFKLLFKELPHTLRRPEVRLTVDYAEDLVFCQQIYKIFKNSNISITVEEIINLWDRELELRKPVENIGLDWGTGRLAWTSSDKEQAEMG